MTKFIKLSKNNLYRMNDFAEFWIINGNPIDVKYFPMSHLGYVIQTILNKHAIQNPDKYMVYSKDINTDDIEKLQNSDLSQEEIDVISRKESPTDYAVKNWGWIRISGGALHMPNISSSSLMQASQAILQIFGPQNAREQDWFIITPTKNYDHVNFDVIEHGDTQLVNSQKVYAKISKFKRISHKYLKIKY
jgi:hypothetical protein